MVPEPLDWLNSTITSGSAGSTGSLQPPASSGLPPTRPVSLNAQATTEPDPQELKLNWFRDFRGHFDKWVIEPIDRLVSSQDALIGFIFMACTIDYLAGFWCGGETKKSHYIGFIKEYFRPKERYDADDLYTCLRNGFVHNFTLRNGKYILTHNQPDRHLTRSSNQLMILNAGNFRDDLIAAKNKYFDGVEADTELLEKAYRRYTKIGFFEPTPL